MTPVHFGTRYTLWPIDKQQEQPCKAFGQGLAQDAIFKALGGVSLAYEPGDHFGKLLLTTQTPAKHFSSKEVLKDNGLLCYVARALKPLFPNSRLEEAIDILIDQATKGCYEIFGVNWTNVAGDLKQQAENGEYSYPLCLEA